ncbi:SAM-dependent methyltransferase [bacterium]|nr:SAM-dependent methyltransferase [bacterium]
MKQQKRKSLEEADVRRLLGEISAPGSIADFTRSLHSAFGNIIRRRAEIPSDSLPFQCDEIPWYELGARPSSPSARPTRTLDYATANYFVQDAGSLLALAVANAEKKAKTKLQVCDLCASPGGKASALLEHLSGTNGFLLANEVIRSRVAPLAVNLARTGSDRYAISSLDPDQLADRLAGVFDLVLIDAPCSGQAMFSRGKQSRSAFSDQQIEHSAARQRRILDAAVKLLKSGGQLVYSTCTFAYSENEAQIERLLSVGVAETTQCSRLRDYQSADGCYRLWPHQHQCAGAFAGSMQIQSEHLPQTIHRFKRSREKPLVELSTWYENGMDDLRFKQTSANLVAWPSNAPEWTEKIACGGPELAYRTGNTWKPAHFGALRRCVSALPIQHVDVDEKLANDFLQGQTIATEIKDWAVVLFKNRPLGWIKGSRGIGKNHLPGYARFNGPLTAR